jgi:hypothetical protein
MVKDKPRYVSALKMQLTFWIEKLDRLELSQIGHMGSAAQVIVQRLDSGLKGLQLTFRIEKPDRLELSQVGYMGPAAQVIVQRLDSGF